MSFSLEQLHYEFTALEPYISSRTVDFHYNKHHKGYLDNLNRIIQEKSYNFSSLEDAIYKSYGKPELAAVYNNSAQVWNHTFYWHSMTPAASYSDIEESPLHSRIISDFGSYSAFSDLFVNTGMAQFGSGWVWLVLDKNSGKLAIEKTSNADSPLVISGNKPLLVSDVWEHAYYLDFQNLRKKYLEDFLGNLANWKFALENLDRI